MQNLPGISTAITRPAIVLPVRPNLEGKSPLEIVTSRCYRFCHRKAFLQRRHGHQNRFRHEGLLNELENRSRLCSGSDWK